MNRLALNAVLAAVLVATAPAALAHGDKHDDKKSSKAQAISTEEHSFGRQGDPKKVSRTVTVDMSDAMRFSPSEVRVREGETIRFVAKNGGKVMHEMVLGNLAELKAHGEMMKKFPNMEHDAPYMAHVPPGTKQEIVWTFTKAGEFHYGCLLPGHLEAGMIGKVIVAGK
ncbi:MAG: cupredoxin family protein [Betaproteobacteria bacterium]|nr:cupredoxin family protein [Betaproteobacteria bacterium]